MAITGALQTVLFGIEAVDPVTFVEVALAVLVSAIIPSWIPAHGATRIDPAVALWSE